MKAKELISDNIPIVNLDDTGFKVINMMDAFGVSHLPVVQDDVFLGLLSEEDIYQHRDLNLPISDYTLKSHGSFVFDKQHIYDVVGIAARKKLSLIPVVQEEHIYLGAVVASELLVKLDDLLCVEVPGTILVLELNSLDYSLSEISQIVEYNDSKVLSLYVRQATDSKKILLTLKIKSGNIISVIESFNRYEYVIKEIYSNENHDRDVYEDRFNNLMRYLDF
jgi:predicted transcriptional regulator